MKKLLIFLGFMTPSSVISGSIVSCFLTNSKQLEIKYFFLNSDLICDHIIQQKNHFKIINAPLLYAKVRDLIIIKYHKYFQTKKIRKSDFDFYQGTQKKPKPWLIKIYNGNYDNETNLINSNNKQFSFINGFKTNHNFLYVKILTTKKEIKDNLNENKKGLIVKCYFQTFIFTTKSFQFNEEIILNSNSISKTDTLRKNNVLDIQTLLNVNLGQKNQKQIKEIIGNNEPFLTGEKELTINQRILDYILYTYRKILKPIFDLNLITFNSQNFPLENKYNPKKLNQRLNNYLQPNAFSIYTKTNNIVKRLENNTLTLNNNTQEIYARLFLKRWDVIKKVMIPANDDASLYLYLGIA